MCVKNQTRFDLAESHRRPIHFVLTSHTFRFCDYTFQKEVDVVGHQDESKDVDVEDTCQYGNGIHPSLEIIFVPEPDTIFQMIGGNKI